MKTTHRTRAELTLSIRDRAGRIVQLEGDLAPGAAELSLATKALAPGAHEAVLRVVVTAGAQVVSEHTHRFTFAVA